MTLAPPLALPGPAAAVADADEQILVDALPYLDTDFSEADRQVALKLIDQECKVFRSTKNYLRHLAVPDYESFLTPCMIKEHARMAKKQEMPKLDMSRCELPSPAGTSKAGDKNAWRKAIRNAKAQNEHLSVRAINLELMDEYAPELYLQRNKELEALLTEDEKALRKTKEQVMEIHAHRKIAQMEAGRQLKSLEENWVSMISKNYRMEMANNELGDYVEREAKRLRLDLSQINLKPQ